MSIENYILSPSSLNLFLKEPALWVMKYFYGIRGEGSIYTMRGKLVEDRVNQIIEGSQQYSFYKHCLSEILLDTDNIEIREQDLKDFEKWGNYAYNCLPKELNIHSIVSMQRHVKTVIKGVTVGGYIDYEYPECIVDLKTTNKLPIICSRGERKDMISKTKVDNVRQQVVYHLATKKTIKLLYVTPTDHLLYTITQRDIEEVMPSILEGIKKIKKCLTLKKEDAILHIQPEKTNSFYWTDKLREEARKIWNIK